MGALLPSVPLEKADLKRVQTVCGSAVLDDLNPRKRLVPVLKSVSEAVYKLPKGRYLFDINVYFCS